MWNDCKNSIRRACYQHTLLLSSTLSNAAHGPYGSGRNQQSIQEAASSLSKSLSTEEFEELVDAMLRDRNLHETDDYDIPGIPTEPADIPELDCVRRLPVYAPKQNHMV